jgi:hypothetical protein
MSDNEQEDQGQMSELAKVLSRYKSTKGDADKRKETSKLNMAKARAAKLEKLKQEKQVKQVKQQQQQDSYEYEDDDSSEDDSEDSEEEELVLRPRGKKKQQVKQQQGTGRMDMLEKAILMLAERTTKKAKAKPKKKAVRKTTVIQVNPAPQQAPVPKGPAAAPTKQVELMMNDLLRF